MQDTDVIAMHGPIKSDKVDNVAYENIIFTDIKPQAIEQLIQNGQP
ncbi:hypothetical protein MGSAQ_002393, partial [marine sediment metagenome]